MEMLAVVGVVALIVYLWSQRGNELFCLSVRAGRVLIVRGRVAAGRCWIDSGEVVGGVPAVAGATIRAVRGDHGARLLCSGGIDERRAQRLRNVFGLYQDRAAPGRRPHQATDAGTVAGDRVARLAARSQPRRLTTTSRLRCARRLLALRRVTQTI